MKIISITELIRNSKKVINWVSKNETVIVHRKRGIDLVIISFEEWNKLNDKENLAISPTYNKPYNKETQEAIQTSLNGESEDVENVNTFFKNL